MARGTAFAHWSPTAPHALEQGGPSAREEDENAGAIDSIPALRRSETSQDLSQTDFRQADARQPHTEAGASKERRALQGHPGISVGDGDRRGDDVRHHGSRVARVPRVGARSGFHSRGRGTEACRSGGANQAARTRLDTKQPAAPDTRRPVTPPIVKSTKTLFPAPAVESGSTGRGAITITGCLERDGQRYWLKDTTGADVQASRSWKSGFMKKRPPRFEVVDATKTLKLTNHVGARVATTGTLANREMQARSLRRLAASCS